MVHGATKQVTAAIASSANTYSSGQAVGTTVKLDKAFQPRSGGVIKTLLVRDKASQGAALTVLIFRVAPTGTVTDHSSFSLSNSDLDNLVAKINVAATDYETIGGKAVARKDVGDVVLGADPASIYDDLTGSLWVVVVTTGTPTYTANCLSLALGLLND